MENYMISSITTQAQEAQRVIVGVLADQALVVCEEVVAEVCITSLSDGVKILLAGNGGNAADTQHIVSKFVSRFVFERPVCRQSP
jgi:D-sedoheptulose 7-phosphate isomerase